MRRVVTLVAIVVLSSAFGGANARAQEAPPDRVPVADFEPLPPSSPSAAAVAARNELLGPGWDDRGAVTLYWYGVSSFIVSLGGHVFLFDAWEIIGLHADYSPVGREDLAAIEPEAILIGHGHFDHAADAGYVAGRTGAVVVGSEEICDTAKEDAARDGNEDAFTCVITGTMDEPPPGTTQELRLFSDLAPVTVLQHLHSAATPPGEDNEPDPFLPVGDPAPYIEQLNDDPEALLRFLETLGDEQGGTWAYHFRVGEHFTLYLGDSAGPIFTSTEVQEALDSFPGCIDVMANAILGFDQPVSGLQDPRLYVEHGHPKVFIPTHADAWAPVISAGQASYVDEFEAQMALLEHPPEVLWLFDPEDYLEAVRFELDDPRWVAAMPGSSCVAAAGGGGSANGSTGPGPGSDGGGGTSTPVTGGVVVALALGALVLALTLATGAGGAGRAGS
ncbi:MAG: MBL fold metallo-hydrolase [Actinobacteria bacterium]|nr:MBL fold metallo-hydrolase [Actinomycetota bacterium]